MFSKKILVIKQTAEGFSTGQKPACGICRMEKENGVFTAFLSLIGFAALTVGEYRLYAVGDDKTVFERSLGKIPSSCVFSSRNGLNLDKGVSVGVWSVNGDLPLLVAFGKTDDARLSVKEYDAAVINGIIADRKIREREKEFAADLSRRRAETAEVAASGANARPFSPTETAKTGETDGFSELFPPVGAYNDEAVATENYYADDGINRKLSCIKEISDEYDRRESDGGNSGGAENSEKGRKDACASQNETRAFGGENAPYYLSVKSELDGIFSRFPAETVLENAFTGSRFAKVFYSEKKYYVVGLIKEKGKEKYICYGVPSVYRETPPKELAGYCSFVPLSVFDLNGDGYFMMFQDAYTGKCVHLG